MLEDNFLLQFKIYDEENALLKKLIKIDDLNELLDIIKIKFINDIPFDGYSIALLNDSKDSLIIYDCFYHGNYKEMEKVHIHNKINLNNNDYFARCYNSDKILHLTEDDLLLKKDVDANKYSRWGVKNELYLPITAGNKKIGVVCLYRLDNKFTDFAINDSKKIIDYFSESLFKTLSIHYLKEKDKESSSIITRNQKVLELANEITKLTSLDVIYEMILKAIIKIFKFDIAAIFLNQNNFLKYIKGIACDDNKDANKVLLKYSFYFNSVKGYEIKTIDGATGNVFIKNDPLYFKDLSNIMNLPMAEKDKNGLMALEKPRTLLLMPILNDEKPIGVFQLWGIFDNMVELSESDINTISKLCSFFGTAIKNSELYTIIDNQNRAIETAKNEIEDINKKLIHDLKIAKRIQESIIKNLPELPDIYIEAEYLAMESLGGDVYDARRIGKHFYSFMISDVSGHGLPAALITTMAKTSFINHSHFSKTPDITCKEVNSDLYESIGNTDYYLSAFYSILDLQKLELLYTNCGHQDGIIYKYESNEIIELKATGLFIGIMDNPAFEFKKINLDIHDKIILYTDGITEARNNAGNFYTNDRLMNYIKNNGKLNPSVFLKGLLDDLNTFCEDRAADDDRAILLIEILPKNTDNNSGEKDLFIDTASLSQNIFNPQFPHDMELLKEKILALGLKDISYNDQITNSIALYKNNKHEQALEILEKLYPYFKDDIRLLNLIGIILFKKKQFKESLTIFNDIKKTNPDFPNIEAIIGLISKKMKLSEKALV